MKKSVVILMSVFVALSLSGQEVRTYEQMSEEMSKQDIERTFEAVLSDYVNNYQPATEWMPEKLVRVAGNVWMTSKGKYEDKTCRNMVFYTREENGEMVPLFNPSMPEETVRTLCSIDCGKEIDVKLVFNRYGYKYDHAKCRIGALVGFFLKEGCVPYVQIDEVGEENVTVSLIMVNRSAKYNHVMKVVVPRAVLENASTEVDVTLNAYVPTHNVKAVRADK